MNDPEDGLLSIDQKGTIETTCACFSPVLATVPLPAQWARASAFHLTEVPEAPEVPNTRLYKLRG